jgi:hypothetical protein
MEGMYARVLRIQTISNHPTFQKNFDENYQVSILG